MKTIFPLTRILFAAALVFWCDAMQGQVYSQTSFTSGGGKEQHSVLTINADGSCSFVASSLESRIAVEQMVRTRERYRKMQEESDDLAQPEQPDLTATNETKPFSDDELARKISGLTDDQDEDRDAKTSAQVGTNTVLITTTRSFASLEEMLKASYSIWTVGGLFYENARLETDTNGLLRLTLTPPAEMQHGVKTFRSAWKLSGAISELKLIFPGKIVSSDFPATQTNATWLTVDGKKDDSLDAAEKIYAKPAVITAEGNGLKLPQPLESKKLWRSGRFGAAENEDLPVTDAGPGFLAEAQSITTTTLHVFPGGENYFKNNTVATGAVVNAKLFSPKGRTLQSVSGVRVIAATDDKGRSVLIGTEDGENDEQTTTYESMGRGAADASSAEIQLRLQLPQPDAQAIEKISAEAVALTVGAWKEMPLTNLQENGTNETDLSAVLPGAKIVITKYSMKRQGQLVLQATLTGPLAIRRLELRAKMPGNEQFNSYSSERGFKNKNGVATRSVTLQGYGFTGEDAAAQSPIAVFVRYPEDLRRDRVKIELKGLDLL